MKAAGAVCILLGTLLGQSFFLRERRLRREVLSELRLGLFRMAEEIRVSRPAFPSLLENPDCGAEAARFFRAVADALRRGESLDAAWDAAAERLPITDADRRILRSPGADLRGDAERIRTVLSAASERLAERVEELDASRRDETRRVLALSLSGAALLVILLA